MHQCTQAALSPEYGSLVNPHCLQEIAYAANQMVELGEAIQKDYLFRQKAANVSFTLATIIGNAQFTIILYCVNVHLVPQIAYQ